MAVATTTAIALGLGLAGSAKQMIDSAQLQEQANQSMANAAANLAVNEEKNKMADLKVPTLGLDYAQQEIQRQMASAIRASQESGNVASLPGIVAEGREADLQLAARADQLQYNRDLQAAQNAQNVEARNAQRARDLEMSRMAGAQNAYAQGLGMEQQAWKGLVDVAGQGLTAYEQGKPLYEQQIMPAVQPARYADTGQIATPLAKQMPVNIPSPTQAMNNSLYKGATLTPYKLPPSLDWKQQANSPAPFLGL